MNTKHSHALDQQLDTYGTIARNRSRVLIDEASRSANWKRFAAAAGAAFASASVADAAVTHVVPPAPIRVNADANQAQFIDLDGDEEFDLRIGAGRQAGPIGTNFFSGTARGLYDAELVGDFFFGDSYSYIAIRKFQYGEEITPVQPSLAGSYVRTSITAGGIQYGANGNWGLGQVGFAGIVDGINGQPRAGWIQIRTVALSGRLRAIEVLSWAYESVSGVSIMAGQTSSVSIPGDYDNNGEVETEDYTLWKNTFGNTVTAGTGADGNSDTKVNAADYTVWRDNFGSGGGSLSAAVPEPATVTLGVLALGAAGVATLRRRSK